MNNIKFTYIQCPLHKYTFRIKAIRQWVELNSVGYTLNLFCGPTKLKINEVRNDLDPTVNSDFKLDAFDFIKNWSGEKFDTIILDPPYAIRKSMEMYGGRMYSNFNKIKDNISPILKRNGRVITFGYHSNSMGKKGGYYIDHIALFSHGGAIHDTIATIEIYGNKKTILFNEDTN